MSTEAFIAKNGKAAPFLQNLTADNTFLSFSWIKTKNKCPGVRDLSRLTLSPQSSF